MPRPTPFRSLALASVTVVALLLAGALPASAAVTIVSVTPSISGSGTVTSASATCNAGSHTATGVVTSGCAAVIGSGDPVAVVSLTAVPQSVPAGHWHFVRWESTYGPCDLSTSTICSVAAAGGSAFYTARAIFADLTGPTVTAPTVGHSSLVDRTVTPTWTGNEPLIAAECSIDGDSYTPCTNGAPLTLAEGSHSIRVRGTDASGNKGAASAAATFRIIDTAISDGPSGSSNDRSPTFGFTSLGGLTFECSIDSVLVTPCGAKGPDGRGTKALSDLADGVHTFRVRAKDGPEFDYVPVVRTWTVDTVAPTATLTPGTGPGEGALQAADKESFAFSSNEGGTFQCRLDNADFAACSSGITVEGLAPGAHRFEVRAVDAAGNLSPALTRSWSIAAPDKDGDGFNSLIDCNDGDATIRPGAIEIAGNKIDENCDGVVEPGSGSTVPPSEPFGGIKFAATPSKKTTRLTKLEVSGLLAGAKVKLTCKGKGCPKALKHKGTTKTAKSPTLSLTKLIKSAGLSKGAAVTITASATGQVTAITTLTVKTPNKVAVARKCLPAGAKKPRAC